MSASTWLVRHERRWDGSVAAMLVVALLQLIAAAFYAVAAAGEALMWIFAGTDLLCAVAFVYCADLNARTAWIRADTAAIRAETAARIARFIHGGE